MSFVLSVLPMVLIIAFGYAVAKLGMIPRAEWHAIEMLSFRVLIPAILILAIVRSDLAFDRFGGMIPAVIVTLTVLGGIVFGLRQILGAGLGNPQFTTLFQTSIRWNAFVALAAVEQLTVGGLPVIAVVIAVSIPVINIVCILVLAGFGPGRTSLAGILKTVARNPLVQACAVGLALNLLDIPIPGSVEQALDLIGRAALGVGLMVVGAGISLRRLARWNWQVGFGVLMRPVLSPVVFFLVASIIGLSPLQTLVGVIVFASPAASNGYVVARQMGGDAELYVDVLTWQTFVSMCVLPVWAYMLA